MIYGVRWSYVVYVLAVKSSCSYLQEFCVFDLSPSCSRVYVWSSKLQKYKMQKCEIQKYQMQRCKKNIKNIKK